MSIKQSRRNFLKLAGATAATAIAGTAVASENPFGFAKIDLDQQHVAMEGSCGEGKCGGDKKKEGSCGEGKCGGAKKEKEGKCGEGKCGEKKDKSLEGKCGEGKCGGGRSN